MKGLLVLLFIFPCTYSQNYSAPCVGLKPYQIVSPSAAGKWYLVKATKIGNITEDKNTCGFFNTISPCKCIGVNINSTTLPPNIQNYTLQNFGYNEMFNSYALTKIQINRISNNSSIFNAYVPLARVNFTIAVLGTDDYLSWITLSMCDILRDRQGKETRLTWIITRSPVPTNQTIDSATQAIKMSSSSLPSDLIAVNQLNCPLNL